MCSKSSFVIETGFPMEELSPSLGRNETYALLMHPRGHIYSTSLIHKVLRDRRATRRPEMGLGGMRASMRYLLDRRTGPFDIFL